MLKHHRTQAPVSKDVADTEPLDLTMPKSERISEDPDAEELACLHTEEDFNGQILIRLLQQQILLSILTKPDNFVGREQIFHRSRERRKSQRMVDKETTVVSVRRSEANARERNRVQHLADMFDRLRSVLPIEYDVKISKLATLKIASAYIHYLGCILDADNTCRIVESEQVLMFSICEAKIFPKKL